MKTLLTITILFIWKFVSGQSDTFRAQIFVDDSLLVSGGLVVFPLTKDTLKINQSDTAIINLNESKARVFYFLWSGWKSKIFRLASNITSNGIKKVNVPDTTFYKQFEEDYVCPICLKSKYLIPIIYGVPLLKQMKKADRGKIRLGGCIITEFNPKYYCRLDDFEF